MTKSQKIAVEMSELREKINTLEAREELTDDQAREVTEKRAKLVSLEPEYRTAIEEESAALEFDGNDGEGAEFRALVERCEMRNYIQTAVSGGTLDGAERELAQAKGHPIGGDLVLPLEMLEERADVVTTTTNLDGGTKQAGILPRIFKGSVVDWLGVRTRTVKYGNTELPVITAGSTAHTKAEKASQDAEAMTFSATVRDPRRITSNYIFTQEQAISVGPRLEAAMRNDLREATRERISGQIINGNGTKPAVQGVLAASSDPAAATAEETVQGYGSLAASLVDAVYASEASQVRMLCNLTVYSHMASEYLTNEDGTSGLDMWMKNSGGVQTSTHMPVVSSNVSKTLFHLRGMGDREDSTMFMWDGIQMIRSNQSPHAEKGEIRITYNHFWNFQVNYSGAFVLKNIQTA